MNDEHPQETFTTPESPISETEAVTQPIPVEETRFEDLTLAAAFSQFVRRPRATYQNFVSVLTHKETKPILETTTDASVVEEPIVLMETSEFPPERNLSFALPTRRWFESILLVLRLFAFGIATYGVASMHRSLNPSEENGLNVGMPIVVLGIIFWIVAEVAYTFLWRKRTVETWREWSEAPQETDTEKTSNLVQRVGFLIVAGLAAVFTMTGSQNNQFTIIGVIAWVLCIGALFYAFMPPQWSFINALKRTLEKFKPSWVMVALLIIMAVGAIFRLYNLDAAPRDMTSDHVEMLLDVDTILFHDVRNIFFANNGGREALQFYLYAIFTQIFTPNVSFESLKILNILEGVLTIPVMYWFGREMIGRKDKRLGTFVGLVLALMVAVSYWHVTISRLGERIILTPLTVALIFIFFSRALRYRRRIDFILTGLILGIGLYTYQVIRMVPLALAIMMFFSLFANPTEAKPENRGRSKLIINHIILVVMAFAVFLPLFQFTLDYPEDFWRRTSSRIFGEDLVQVIDESGNTILIEPDLNARIAELTDIIPTFLNNVRRALLMYSWAGDVAWWQSAPNSPSFDYITAGLSFLGAVLLLFRILRKGDIVDFMVPVAFLVLILPSALSISFPNENPSATRMSGTMPFAYLASALALAVIGVQVIRIFGKRWGRSIMIVAIVVLSFFSLRQNWDTYFTVYGPMYAFSSPPYTDVAEVATEFMRLNNAKIGNVFIISYPYWLDHRAFGYQAGYPQFQNTVPELKDFPDVVNTAMNAPGDYNFNPNAPLLIFFHVEDTAAQTLLENALPDGSWQMVESFISADRFHVYTAPPIGSENMERFLEAIQPPEPQG